jgi:histidyl-tRNA synthetase
MQPVTSPVDTRTTIHPIPSGTRDVLPDEMRELRDVTEAVRGVFEVDGYGEVWTPTLEYEAVLARGGGAPRTASSTTTARCSRCART